MLLFVKLCKNNNNDNTATTTITYAATSSANKNNNMMNAQDYHRKVLPAFFWKSTFSDIRK
jgi:hypothetical protein